MVVVSSQNDEDDDDGGGIGGGVGGGVGGYVGGGVGGGYNFLVPQFLQAEGAVLPVQGGVEGVKSVHEEIFLGFSTPPKIALSVGLSVTNFTRYSFDMWQISSTTEGFHPFSP